MFDERSLSPAVESVRKEHAPGTLVFDCDTDFELLAPDRAENLALVVDSFRPVRYDPAWVPPESPDVLHRLVGSELTIGMPGDGGVAWTRQTDPPVVLCKSRLTGSPEPFVRFLIAEALVQVGLDEPEHFLGFFESQYPRFASVTRDFLDPTGTYQLAAACYDANLGLQTRDVFADWDGELFDAWLDAGERLSGRLGNLPGSIARGQTSFPVGAEIACSAIKHACEIPRPFDALDASVYLDHGPAYAVTWAEGTVEALEGI